MCPIRSVKIVAPKMDGWNAIQWSKIVDATVVVAATFCFLSDPTFFFSICQLVFFRSLPTNLQKPVNFIGDHFENWKIRMRLVYAKKCVM